MRCYICDSEATIVDKRDNAYLCESCLTSAGEAFMEFELGDEYFNVKQSLKQRLVKVKEEVGEDTPDLP